jgi:signal peptidase II
MSLLQWANRSRQKTKIVPFIILLITISTDQYTKLLARRVLEPSSEISFFNNFINFSLIKNHGGFLGIVSQLPEKIQFFLLNICVSGLLLCCLAYLFVYKNSTTRYDIILAAIVGGGVSNLLDRLLHNGGVTDFLSIGVGNLRTGIFNLADVYILIGSFVLGYSLVRTFPQSD